MLASYFQKDNFLVSMPSKVEYLIAAFFKTFPHRTIFEPYWWDLNILWHCLSLELEWKLVFQPCGHCRVFQIFWHIEGITLAVSSFRIWNSSAEIPSPPRTWFLVLLSKARLTSHSRMSSSTWETIPSWLSGSLRPFLYSFSVYSCNLFLISSAFTGSLPFLSFILLIFAWNIPLVSPIFLKKALVFPKITADGDCSHEIKRHFVLGRKAMTKLCILKSRVITLPTKANIVKQTNKKGKHSQSYGFSSSHVWMWEVDYNEDWAPRNGFFWTVVLEKTLKSLLDSKMIKPVGNQPWIFVGRIETKAEALILWPPRVKSWLIEKDPDTGKD